MLIGGSSTAEAPVRARGRSAADPATAPDATRPPAEGGAPAAGSTVAAPRRNALLARFDGRFVRFVLVGASNTIVSFCVFEALVHLLRHAAFGITLAQFVGYSAGIVWSFVWNSRFTFHSRAPVVTRGVRFLVVQLSMALASTAGIGVCAHVLRWAPTPSWFAVMVPVTIGNFLLSKHWVFLPA